MGTDDIAAANEVLTAGDAKDDAKLKARKTNGTTYNAVILASRNAVFFNAVDETNTGDLPNGDSKVAWETC